MGFGLCDSWEQEAVPQESSGQGANPGCERDGTLTGSREGCLLLLQNSRRLPGGGALGCGLETPQGKEWARQLRSGTGGGTGPLLVDW